MGTWASAYHRRPSTLVATILALKFPVTGVYHPPAHNMFIFLFFPLVSGQNYPGALCNVTYSIPISCNEVSSKIVAQIDLWNEEKSCPGRCDERNSLSPQRGPPLEPVLLQGSVEDNLIQASHITPVIRYKDDLFFRLTEGENGSCDVFGHSHSTGPAYYDFTTNYCNLRNLMTGSGLADLNGSSEDSSTSLCMQYDRIKAFGNCNKY